MDITQRIAQFENMVRPGADPDNDMAWFSLGSAYAEAGRHTDAAAAFQRCVAINPGMSKAYQLAGKALIDAGNRDAAAKILTEGYAVASRKGDLLPKRGIAELLQSIGQPVPETVPSAAEAAGAPEGAFIDRRTGRPGTQMDRPPFRGPLGEWIQQNISKETWDRWIGQGTKVINELRLDLSRDQDEATYDAHMREFLGIDDELHRQIMERRT